MGRVLQILGVLWVVGFAGFFAYDALVNAPKAQAHLGQLEQEAEQIPAPSWARELSRSAGNKTGFALLDRTYIARASYAEIRAFYDNALARSEWRFGSERAVRDWGRDLGGRTGCYQKGDLIADVQYAGEAAHYGWTYSLALSWGLSSCDERVPGPMPSTLTVAGFVSAVPAILLNSLLLMRFERGYRRGVAENMPSIVFDFRGRWRKALATPHPDPVVERERRWARLSTFGPIVPFALAGIGLVAAVLS